MSKAEYKREHWWNIGEAQAIRVYRARVALPMLIATAIVVAPFVMFSDMRGPGAGTFMVVEWIVFTLPILIRRRRAAIFTADSFLYRPVFGRLLIVPLNGMKRARLIEPEPTDDIYVPRVRIELLVGGELVVPIAVSDPEAVVANLNIVAKRELSARRSSGAATP